MNCFPEKLPCGHPAYREEDKIILDHCFECGWATQSRKEADKLNEIAADRAATETSLVKFVKAGRYKTESRKLMQLCESIKVLSDQENLQREIAKNTRLEEDGHIGIL